MLENISTRDRFSLDGVDTDIAKLIVDTPDMIGKLEKLHVEATPSSENNRKEKRPVRIALPSYGQIRWEISRQISPVACSVVS